MKILRIRGENLASLAGRFEIDLTAGVLGSSGLFAITGNTGAGKSTIFDAMTLALYGEAVRFADAKDKKPTGEETKSQSSDLSNKSLNNIMTRGKGFCFSEVEFSADDGNVYKVRWSLKRARSKADGNFQKPERALYVSSGDGNWDLLASKIQEVNSRITDVLHLDWEQFRRMVILPQGNFTAFLKSSSTEQSKLLEVITGTEIYSRVAENIAENCRTVAGKIKDQENQINNYPGASAADVDLRQKDADEVKRVLDLFEQTKVRKTEAVSRYDLLNTERNTLSEWSKKDAAVQQWFADHRADREFINSYDQLSKGKVQLSNYKNCSANLDRLMKAKDDTVVKIDAKKQVSSRLDGELADCMGKLSKFNQEAEEINRRINEARGIQAKIDENSNYLKTAEDDLKLAEEAKKTQEKLKAAKEKEIDSAEKEKNSAGKFCSDNSEFEKSYQNAGMLKDQMVSLLGLYSARDTNTSDIQTAEKKAEEALRAIDDAIRQKTDLSKKIASCSENCRELEDRLNDLKGCNYQDQLTGEQNRRAVYAGLEGTAAIISASLDKLFETRKNLSDGKDKLSNLEDEYEQNIAATDDLRTSYEAQEQLVEDLKNQVGLAQFKDLVKEGEPCPLCGSVTHNQEACDFATDQILRSAESILNVTKHKLKASEKACIRNRSDIDVMSAANAKLADTVDKEENELFSMQESWNNSVQSEKSLIWNDNISQIDDAAGFNVIIGNLSKLKNDNLNEISRLSDLVKTETDLSDKLTSARKLLDDENALLKAAEQKLQQCQDGKAEIDRQVTAFSAKACALSGQISDLENTLNLHLDNNLDGIVSSDTKKSAQSQKKINAWAEKCRQYAENRNKVSELAGKLETLGAELRHLEAGLGNAETGVNNARGKYDRCRKTVEDFKKQFDSLLNGNTVESAEKKLSDDRKKLEDDRTAKEDECRKCSDDISSLNGTLDNVTSSVREAESKLADAEKDLSDFLAENGNIARHEFERIISRDLNEVETMRSAYKSKESESEQLKGRIGSINDNIRQYEKDNCDSLEELGRVVSSSPELSCLGNLTDGDHLCSDWCRAFDQKLGELKTDYDNISQDLAVKRENYKIVKKAEAEKKRLETESENLYKLNEMFKSNKLLNFVQDFVFRKLVDYANVHISKMSNRYSLCTDPNYRLQLNLVDNYMGGELRPVSSASGGETFIVSLALALSLADLSGSGVKIDSLFIDEGFGSLDQNNISIVVNALENLYSSGKQIGIITHVETLIDRVDARIEVRRTAGGASEIVIPV